MGNAAVGEATVYWPVTLNTALVRETLAARGWSLRELARRVNYSHTHVGRILNGEDRPGRQFITRLPEVLGVSAAQLWGTPPTPELPADEAQVLAAYRQLPPREQRVVQALLVSLAAA